MMKRIILLVSMFSVLLIGGCYSAKTEDPNIKEVNWIVEAELLGMDPSTITDIGSGNMVGHVYEGLYWEDSENQVSPALANEMPEISEDQLTYTIKMREDAQWSNGDPITAHDFVYSVQRLVDPATAASYAYLAETIVNANEIMAGEKDKSELGVKALDDYTIEIQLTQPTPHLINLLAFPSFYPLNQSYVESQDGEFATHSDRMISSGPYLFEDWDGTSQSWTLVKNPDYFKADEIAIDRINVQVVKEVSTSANLFLAGQADNAPLKGELARQYSSHPDINIQEQASNYYVRFNHQNPYLQNKNLRLAIDYAIDNEELVTAVLGDGSKAISSYVPSNFIFNPETGADFVEDVGAEVRYDEEKALEHWELAKEELGVEELNFGLLSSDSEGTKRVTEYIQGQVQQALPGVSLDIQNVPSKNRISREGAGDFDIVLSGWIADYASAMNFLELWESESPYNYAKYSNPTYDELIQAAKSIHAADPNQRYADMIEADRILYEDAVLDPLYQTQNMQLLNPHLENLTQRAVGNEYDFRTADIHDNTEE